MQGQCVDLINAPTKRQVTKDFPALPVPKHRAGAPERHPLPAAACASGLADAVCVHTTSLAMSSGYESDNNY
jgi:hypothetical protein